MKAWHGLPREAADAPSLEGLKARLDGALGNLSWWGGSPTYGRGGLEPDENAKWSLFSFAFASS